MSRSIRTLFASVSTCALVLPGAAMAQDVVLEDIVVTARKTEENILQVPMSISALSRQDIEAAAANGLTDLSRLTPGFSLTDQPAYGSGRNDRSTRSLSFRGINPQGNQNDSQTGMMFIDGAPVFNADLGGLTDIERVEVLKGPQNTYFGRSVIAGAVNLITREPAEKFSLRVTGEYGSYGNNDQAVSVEGGIIPGLLNARLSLHHYYKGGQYQNTANNGEKLGERETNSIAGIFLLTPATGLKIKAFATYFVDEDGTPANAALLPSEGTCNAGALLVKTNNYWCGVAPRISPDKISMNTIIDERTHALMIDNITGKKTLFDPHFLQHFGLKRNAFQGTVSMTYDLPNGMSLASITAYHRSKRQVNADTGYRDTSTQPNPNFPANPNAPQFRRLFSVIQSESNDFSQELRLTSRQEGSFRWLAGANYSYLNDYASVVYNLGLTGVTQSSDTGRSKPRTYALFGAAFYDIMPELKLSLEGRYQIDKIYSSAPNLAEPLQATFKSFNPRVSLDYQFDDDTMVYLLWSRGARPGGFNTLLANQPQSVLDQIRLQSNAGIVYKEERLDNYEAGLKARLLDNRMNFTLSAYYAKYQDQRVTQNTFYTNSSGGITIVNAVTNAGRSTLYGFEAELRWQMTDRFLIHASTAYAKTEFDFYDCISCLNYINGVQNQQGNMFPNTPQWTGALSGTYRAPLVDDWKWYLRGDYFYKSTVYGDETNIVETGAQHLVNLQLGVDRGDFMIEAFVKNLTNDDTYPSIITGRDTISAGFNRLVLALPEKRTVGARFSYRF